MRFQSRLLAVQVGLHAVRVGFRVGFRVGAPNPGVTNRQRLGVGSGLASAQQFREGVVAGPALGLAGRQKFSGFFPFPKLAGCAAQQGRRLADLDQTLFH